MHLRSTSRRIALPLTSGLVLGVPALAGELDIADIAPENALFVVGVDQFEGWKASFDRAGFGALLADERVQTWVQNASDEFLPQLRAELDDLGIDMDELSWPTGAVGLAGWFDPENPEDLHVVMIADFGAETEAMDEMFVEALERSADRESIELREEEVEGATVWGVKGIDFAEDADFDDLDAGFMPDLAANQPEELFYARHGDYLFVSSTLDAAGHAVRVFEGDEIDAVRDSDAFQLVRSKLDGDDMYATLMMSPILAGFQAEADSGDEAEAQQAQTGLAVMEALGVSSMHGAGASLAFDTDDAALEMKFALLSDGKDGVLSLVDAEAIGFDPPAFITADAASVSMMRFNFDQIIPLYTRVVASLSPEQQNAAQQMGGMMVPMLQPIFDNLGPDVVMGGYIQRPFSATSEKQTWAIRVKDSQALAQALAGTLPMLGLQARDFQGQQIWAPAPGGFIPPDQFAAGLGFGYMFLGPTDSVENAMRQAGADGAAGLTEEDRFRDAIRVLGATGTMFSYSDTEQGLEFGEWMIKNFDQVIAAQMEAMGVQDLDPEFREEMEADARESTPLWIRTLPPLDIIGEHFGDSVSEVRPTEDGIEGRALWLRPTQRN